MSSRPIRSLSHPDSQVLTRHTQHDMALLDHSQALGSLLVPDFHTAYTLIAWVIAAPLVALLLYILLNEVARAHSRIALLPGPRGYPLLGSLPSLRGKTNSEEYRQWSALYGDVFQLHLGSTVAVVVNSAAAARALFISQREATNSRPEFYVLHKKVQRGNAVTSIGTSAWDHSCKRRRKVAASALNKTSVESYLPVSAPGQQPQEPTV